MVAATTVQQDNSALVHDAIRRVTAIATLPEVTAKIVSVVEDPRSSASQLHKIVAHDPALVTRILKVVNSAFYGLPGQIGSIDRAIVLLGLNAIKNIAVAASLGQLFRGVRLCAEFGPRDLWTHCIAVGVTARELAKQMKVPIVEEAFLAGMIHDLGLLVSLQVFPEKLRTVCETVQQQGGDFCEHERQIIGADHQQLGIAMTESWKFPRSCQLVAGYHHRPMALSDDNRLLVALVYTADTICSQRNMGFNLSALHQSIDPSTLRQLQLDPLLIEQVSAKLQEQVSAASQLLG